MYVYVLESVIPVVLAAMGSSGTRSQFVGENGFELRLRQLLCRELHQVHHSIVQQRQLMLNYYITLLNKLVSCA